MLLWRQLCNVLTQQTADVRAADEMNVMKRKPRKHAVAANDVTEITFSRLENSFQDSRLPIFRSFCWQ